MAVDEGRLEELCTAAMKEIDDGEKDRTKTLRSVADSIADNDGIRTSVRALIDAYEEKIGELEEELRGFKNEEDEKDRVQDAIHAFCDAIERSVGKLTFVVPQSGEVDRAILGLHDAIGRRL